MAMDRRTAATAKPSILCVDDDPRVLEGLQHSLHRDFDAAYAQSGAEAWQILSTREFDLILSDLHMPKMDGRELLRRCARSYPSMVRLILTGADDIGEAVEAVNEGQIFRFLQKPCRRSSLLSALREARQQRDLLRRREVQVQEAETLSSELPRLGRLAELGELAAGIGQEINNVLSLLTLAIPSIAEASNQGRPASREDIDYLRMATRRLQAHGTNLMHLGTTGSEDSEVIDLGTVVESTLKMLKHIGRTKYCDVQVRAPEVGMWIRGARVHLEQILVNVVGNAADALFHGSKRGGTIDIELCLAARAELRVRYDAPGFGHASGSGFSPHLPTKRLALGGDLGTMIVTRLLESQNATLALGTDAAGWRLVTMSWPNASPRHR